MKQSAYLFTFVIILVINTGVETYGQDSPGSFSSTLIPETFFEKLSERSETLDRQLTGKAKNYLNRMLKQEQRLQRKLSKTDSTKAQQIFGNIENRYAMLQQQVDTKVPLIVSTSRKYFPYLDSLQTALKLLDTHGELLEMGRQTPVTLQKALNNLNVLQTRFSQAEEVKEFISRRRKFLTDQLRASGLTKELVKFQKQVYYYQAQVDGIKRDFNNGSKVEAKAISILRKINLFEKFFREHSQLAGLFRMPESTENGTVAIAAVYQTRMDVEQQMMEKFGTLPDMQQMVATQNNTNQFAISKIKSKTNDLFPQGEELEMPVEKINNQKTKSLMKRLELGTNLQTVKSNNFFPSTSDIALSLGYKINERSTIGVGGSYKMGWGKDIRYISLTHQGIGLRSFVDVKLKGSLWLTGGAEMNYRSQFRNFEILDDYTPWQKSALLGLSKKYRVSKKLKGNMQLMYDFLNRQQVPRTQAVIFRIGYIL